MENLCKSTKRGKLWKIAKKSQGYRKGYRKPRKWTRPEKILVKEKKGDKLEKAHEKAKAQKQQQGEKAEKPRKIKRLGKEKC